MALTKDAAFEKAVKNVAPWEFGEIIIAEQHPPGSNKPVFSWVSLDTYLRLERELGESSFNIRDPLSDEERMTGYGITFNEGEMPSEVFIAFKAASSKINNNIIYM